MNDDTTPIDQEVEEAALWVDAFTLGPVEFEVPVEHPG